MKVNVVSREGAHFLVLKSLSKAEGLWERQGFEKLTGASVRRCPHTDEISGTLKEYRKQAGNFLQIYAKEIEAAPGSSMV